VIYAQQPQIQPPARSDVPPPWAYYINPPDFQPALDDGSVLHVSGSDAGFTMSQVRDMFNVADWHPNSHPPMPDVVARGRKPAVRACGHCHLPNGLGDAASGSLAGLPATYIAQRMADFKKGLSKSSEPGMTPAALMVEIAKAATDQEVKSAADYFSSLKMTPWVTVVETDIIPKNHVWESMLVPIGGGTEPVGNRIMEMPAEPSRTALRDSASGFFAYVQYGSIERGKDLANGRVNPVGARILEDAKIKCSLCHGADLRGTATVSGIAGRSPTYMFRQLYDIKHGNRNGPSDAVMKRVVAEMSEYDMIWVSAYTASLAP
jgi:cytochrome c553